MSKIVRIGVTGGRNFPEANLVYETLTKLYTQLIDLNLTMDLVLGDCPTGVDHHALVWCTTQTKAFKRNIAYSVYAADWNLYGKRAGPLRNIEMLNSGLDLLLSFPGGKGTVHMTGICLTAGVMVKRIYT